MIQVAEDILLKSLSESDISRIFNMLNDERQYMRKWLPFVDTTNKEEDIANFVNYVVQAQDQHFTIWYKGEFSGLIGFKGFDSANKRIEIGYWMSEYVQGNGIMVRSVQKLMEFAFSELEMNRIQIKVAVDNEKSKRIPEKLGFRMEGIERDGELLVNNVFTDIAVYSLLKREYKI